MRDRTASALVVAVVALVALGTLPGAGVAAPTDAGVSQAADGAQVADRTAAETTDGCSYPVTMTDATGTEVTVESAPETVVTLGPASAQTMVDIGAGSKIVGATQYASYLDGSEAWANVSGDGRAFVSVERVAAQDPDVVLAENIVSNETVQSLRDLGITVYKFRAASSLEFVYEKVRTTGKLVGACDGAEAEVAWMQEEISIVRDAVADEPKPNALYVFFGTTAGEGTYIHEIITTAGAENVAADADLEYFPNGYATVSAEFVANATVEWLILNSDSPSVPSGEAYQQTAAVQNNNTVVLNADYISQPGPRIVYPIRALAKAMHPEAYAAANESARETTTLTTSDPTTSADDETMGTATTSASVTDDGGSGGTPGFGVGAVIAALAATLLLRRRR